MNDMSDIPQDLLTQSIAGRRLDNKCIILTGAAGSIGSYITRQLLREGARVMLTGRDQGKLDDFMGDLVDEGFEETFMVSATGDCADPEVCRQIVAKTLPPLVRSMCWSITPVLQVLSSRFATSRLPRQSNAQLIPTKQCSIRR